MLRISKEPKRSACFDDDAILLNSDTVSGVTGYSTGGTFKPKFLAISIQSSIFLTSGSPCTLYMPFKSCLSKYSAADSFAAIIKHSISLSA